MVTLPAKSVSMFRLSGLGTGIKTGSIRTNEADAFSICSGVNGIIITSLTSREMPVTISLFSLDGKTLVDRVTKTFRAENGTCVLGNNNKGKGIYIVKITGANINLSKHVAVE
jgi:hypothetical protein